MSKISRCRHPKCRRHAIPAYGNFSCFEHWHEIDRKVSYGILIYQRDHQMPVPESHDLYEKALNWWRAAWIQKGKNKKK